jgi:hypothetical protein
MWHNIEQGTIVSNCQGHMQQRTQKNELMRFHGNSVMLYRPHVLTDWFYNRGLTLYAQWSLYVLLVKHSVVLRSAHTVYLCVLCGSQNKQWLFPYTTLTDWFV